MVKDCKLQNKALQTKKGCCAYFETVDFSSDEEGMILMALSRTKKAFPVSVFLKEIRARTLVHSKTHLFYSYFVFIYLKAPLQRLQAPQSIYRLRAKIHKEPKRSQGQQHASGSKGTSPDTNSTRLYHHRVAHILWHQ